MMFPCDADKFLEDRGGARCLQYVKIHHRDVLTIDIARP
jgi:hypothetical protein